MFNVLLITAVKFTNKIVKNTTGHRVILNNFTTFLADSQTNFGLWCTQILNTITQYTGNMIIKRKTNT